MADKLQFDLVTPEALLVSERVDAVSIAGVDGDFCVLPDHAPLMSMLRAGVLTVENNGRSTRFELSGGFADVTAAGVTVLADSVDKS